MTVFVLEDDSSTKSVSPGLEIFGPLPLQDMALSLALALNAVASNRSTSGNCDSGSVLSQTLFLRACKEANNQGRPRTTSLVTVNNLTTSRLQKIFLLSYFKSLSVMHS